MIFDYNVGFIISDDQVSSQHLLAFDRPWRREIMIARISQNCKRRKKNTSFIKERRQDWNQRWDLWSTKAHYVLCTLFWLQPEWDCNFYKAPLILLRFRWWTQKGRKSPRKKVNIDQNIIMIWCRCAQNCITGEIERSEEKKNCINFKMSAVWCTVLSRLH